MDSTRTKTSAPVSTTDRGSVAPSPAPSAAASRRAALRMAAARWLTLPEVRAALIATALLRIVGGIIVASVCYALNGVYFHAVQVTQQIQSQDKSGAIYAGPTRGSPFVEFLTAAWVRWDAGHYIAIARHSYYYPVSTAFMPLYPLAIRVVSYPLGGHYIASALVISTVATFCAFILLHRLISRLTGSPRVATFSVAVAALLPIAFFFVAPYTESLYLALSLATVLAVLDRRWTSATVLATLASLTRQQGVALALLAVPPILAAIRAMPTEAGTLSYRLRAFWTRAGRPTIFACVSVGAYVAWLLFVRFVLHAPTPYEQVTFSPAWGQHLTLPGLGLLSDIWFLAQDPGFRLLYDHALLLDLVAAFLALIGLIVTRRALPSSLLLYLIGCWCLAIIKVEPNGITMSAGRYLLVLLPLCMVPATWLARARPGARLAYVGFSLVVGCIFLSEWVLWLWVS